MINRDLIKQLANTDSKNKDLDTRRKDHASKTFNLVIRMLTDVVAANTTYEIINHPVFPAPSSVMVKIEGIDGVLFSSKHITGYTLDTWQLKAHIDGSSRHINSVKDLDDFMETHGL